MIDRKTGTSRVLILMGILALACLTGCVERKLTINTAPQGALVWLNDEEIGFSPVTVEFNWYGDYKIRAEKQDYAILNTHRKLKAPSHDGFPMDFFAQILWPGKIQDYYEWTFDLTPYEPVNRQLLISAAEQMKKQAQTELTEDTPQADSE